MEKLKSYAATHVVAQQIEPTVIARRLLGERLGRPVLDLAHEVVLGDEVRGTRMQAARKEARDEEVHERVPAEKVHKHRVEREHGEEVDAVPDGWFLGPDEARSEGVEE